MTRSKSFGTTIALAAMALVSGMVWAADRMPTDIALAQLQAAAPEMRVDASDGQLTLFGTALAHGSSAVSAAEKFRTTYAETLGITSDELVPLGGLRGAPAGEPMMYDAATGAFRFTLVRYQQQRDGVPVHKADVRMLVLNRADHPVTWVGAALKDLGDFQVPQLRAFAVDQAQDAALAAQPALDQFTAPEAVIWAGRDKAYTEPVLAITFIAESGTPEAGPYERWRFVCDAQTGAVLEQENLIYLENITGTSFGTATPGDFAAECAVEVPTAMRYAQVQITGGATAYTDTNGAFTLTNAGTTPVTVTAYLRGTYFRVENAASGNAVPSMAQTVTPPGPVNFLFNAANTDALVRAQVNGYLNANDVRDFVLAYSPTYPVIGTQTNFRITVNRTDMYCPGNAWYDGTGLNFCQANTSYSNTSFAGVAHHEYGHHLVEVAGSGQDQYGEGMGDCVAVLISDDPRLGVGFFLNNCTSGLRNADNTMQYPCSGEAHDCAGLLSGCIWDLREQLLVTNPSNYIDILAPLTFESIRMHAGSSIGRDITNAFLTLDDNDGNLGNGTPHSAQILAAFGLHNMVPQPPPANDACANAIPVCPGTPVTGSTSDATVGGTAACGTSNSSPDVWYTYTPQTAGSATFSLCGTGTTYDSVISVRTACTGGTELGCDDDGCGGQAAPSTVTATVTAGVTYYIRVSGWQGAAGAYRLTLTGPACTPNEALSITLPNGAPAALPPGVSSTMTVRITNGSQTYVPGSGLLHYRYNGGAYATTALTPLSGNDYTATFPAGPNCGDTPEFYVTAQGNGGANISFPTNAPTSVLSATVGTMAYILNDNFESDAGWTLSNTASVTAGFWQRGVPVNDPNWTYAPAADADGSGKAWLTENDNNPNYADPFNTDLDGGSVTATSPVIDMTGAGLSIAYSYYLRLTSADGTDRLALEINTNNGVGTWTQIANHTTDGARTWRTNAISASALATAGVTPTATTRIRFTATDGGTASVVEAGFDALQVAKFTCTPVASCSDGVLNQGEARIDCGGPCAACACTTAAACDDGLYCDGVETCDLYGECAPGSSPCAAEQVCNEALNSCSTLPACAASDVNCDGDVNGGDILSIRAPGVWSTSGAPGFSPADVNLDGEVNGGDILGVRAPGVWSTSTGVCQCNHL